jgi:hypothetical protein
MKRLRAATGEREAGAIMIIIAMCVIVLVGMLSIAIDLSYGFLQNRRAQNASDFAAFAAAQQLNGSLVCNGSGPTPNMQQLVTLIQHVINDNTAAVGTSWSGRFIDGSGHYIGTSVFTPASSNAGVYPPPGACGLSVNGIPVWKPFFAGVFKVTQLNGYATGAVSNSTTGGPVGIVSLNKVGPHAVLGGGSGTFIVNGDMVINTDVANQPWTQSHNNWQYDDAVDAKSGSNLWVYGTVHTNPSTYQGESLWPLDWCFAGSAPAGLGTTGANDPTYQGGNPATNPPTNSPSCSAWSGVTFAYNHIDPADANIPISDPLAATGAPTSPLASPSTSTQCPGLADHTYAVSPSSGQLLPGIYPNPVKITGSAVFADCSGYGGGEPAYPGIYVFQQGLWIDPLSSGNAVTGANVVLATQTPYPVAGNVPGSLSGSTFTASGAGNGAPCLPNGTIDSGGNAAVDGSSGSKCGGTSPKTYGVVARNDSSYNQDTSNYGSGNNFSLLIGGASGATVTLTGPTSGGYAGAASAPGLVLYQDAGTQANYGFDAESADAAAISITGVVYNASLTSYGASAPQDYWDVGIPFYAGGTLQTGYGSGWSSGPAVSTGSVTINGTCIVDNFNTDGASAITIYGQPYALPGGSKLALIG